MDRLEALGKDLRALGHVRFAAIGPKTAQRLREYHLNADVVPPRYQSEDLAAALLPVIEARARVLLVRADRGRALLREVLGRVANVWQIAVYSQVDAIPPTHPVLDRIERGEVDAITFTSSNIAKAL